MVGSIAHRKDNTSFLDAYRRVVPSIQIVAGVSGYNQTETIVELLKSKLRFHNLSWHGRRWGKLATFLTKYRLLQRQVALQIPFQVSLEDDLVLQNDGFYKFMSRACAYYNKHPEVDVMQLSMYAEAMLTSLRGATTLVQKIQQHGILANDDSQLLDVHYMGHRRSLAVSCLAICYRRWRRPGDTRQPPWVIGRKTNSGDIAATRSLSWAEIALLRVATQSPSAALPLLGQPPGVEFGDEFFERRRTQRLKRISLERWLARNVSARRTQRGSRSHAPREARSQENAETRDVAPPGTV